MLLKGSQEYTIFSMHGSLEEVYNIAKRYGIELIKDEYLDENARVCHIECEEPGMHPFIAELYEIDDLILSKTFGAMQLPESIDDNTEKIILTKKEITLIHKHLRGEMELGATEEDIMLLDAVLDRAESLMIKHNAYDAIDGPNFDLLAWYLELYEKQENLIK